MLHSANISHAAFGIVITATCYSYLLTYLITSSLLVSSCYRTVASAIWGMFHEFVIFFNLIREPLGELNNSKI